MTGPELRELLDVIAEKAPKLQERGIESVNVQGVAFAIRAKEPEAAADDGTVDDDFSGDVLKDPATHGLRGKGAKVPGLSRGGES